MPKVSDAPRESMESLATHHALLEMIVAALGDQLAGLQKQITQETTLLVTTREQHERMQADFRTERERAYQHLNGELEAERLALKTRWAEVEQTQKDLGDAQGDLRRLAEAQAQFEQEKRRLTDVSIAIEQDRVASVDRLAKSEHHEQQGLARLQEAIAKERHTAQQLAEAETLSQQTAQQLEAINLKTEAHAATLSRLEALREEIDPKLQAMRETEAISNDAAVKAERLHGEAMQRIAESQQLESDLQGLAARLEAREEKLLELHIHLRQFSLELTAKAQHLKAQGAEVSTPPVVPPVEGPPVESPIAASPAA